MPHAPEPWTVEFDGKVHWILSGDKIIAKLREGAIYGGQGEDAERIAACVNACRGLSTKMLQKCHTKPIPKPSTGPQCLKCGGKLTLENVGRSAIHLMEHLGVPWEKKDDHVYPMWCIDCQQTATPKARMVNE